MRTIELSTVYYDYGGWVELSFFFDGATVLDYRVGDEQFEWWYGVMKQPTVQIPILKNNLSEEEEFQRMISWDYPVDIDLLRELQSYAEDTVLSGFSEHRKTLNNEIKIIVQY